MSDVETIKTIDSPVNLSEDIISRRDDLANELERALLPFSVTMEIHGGEVHIKMLERLICGVSVEREVFKLFYTNLDWSKSTTYRCEEELGRTGYYFIDTIDECLEECRRLVSFEASKETTSNIEKQSKHTSELSEVLDFTTFERAFSAFVKQAEKNSISGKAQGGQTPYGFSKKPICDGADVCTHFGQGGASRTPYLNWWVVSVYFLPENGNIFLGIEENRYPHLKEMSIKPNRYQIIGNKQIRIALFYSTTKTSIDYAELYESFLNISEEVMRLGLR